jgi:hypothetical protein
VPNKDQADLKKFDALAAKLAPLMALKRVTESQCLRSERLMYAMGEICRRASPSLRKIIKQRYGWKS